MVHKPIKNWGDTWNDFDAGEALAGAEENLSSVYSPASGHHPNYREDSFEEQPGGISPLKIDSPEALIAASRSSFKGKGMGMGGKGVIGVGGKGGSQAASTRSSPTRGKGGKGGHAGEGSESDEAESSDEEDFVQARKMAHSSSRQLLKKNTSNG
jgi:hypothetical protein